MTLVRSKESHPIEERALAELAWEDDAPADLMVRAEELRLREAADWGSVARRLLFVWFRIYVVERENGKWQRVNVRIPLPIPIVGGFLRRKMSQQQAIKALTLAHGADADMTGLERYLSSIMALELIRVEETDGHEEDGTLVVLGLD